MSIHALFVATNFEGTQNALPDCILDARNWRKLLEPYCASSTLLLGKKASRNGIVKAGRKWLDRLEPGDLGILLFSQHGAREKINGVWHEAIVCDDLELLYDFESNDLLRRRAPKTHVVALLDTCHSGGMPRGNPRIARTIPLSRCTRHKATPPAKMRALRNGIIYAGCEPQQYSYSTGKGGAMSLAMQKAIGEKGADCTFGWLHRRVAGKHGLLPTDEFPQTPTVTASVANLRRTLRSFVG